MTQMIDPREVLTYLNELGYTNISAQQLKDFIKDLKKVIKYDYHYGGASLQVNETSVQSAKESSYSSQDISCSPQKIIPNKTNKENVHPKATVEHLVAKSSSTQTSMQRPTSHKGRHISLHIFENKLKEHFKHDHCIHLEPAHDKNNLGTEKMKSKTYEANHDALRPESTESTIKSIPPCSSRELVSKQSQTSSKHVKIKKTFIRPAVSKPCVNKCDPVALYHYYQSEWQRSKIPGQDSRDDLRWAIRARMLSGPKVEVKSKCNIPRCGWSR